MRRLAIALALATLAATCHATPFTVAAVQTELRFYPTADAFTRHMGQRVETAMRQKPRPDLLVLPEDIGTPLTALGDYDLITSAQTLKQAIGYMAERHAADIASLCARWDVSPLRGLWLLKADTALMVYRDTFSALARRYRVPIVAGSVPLTAPEHPADVFNAACLFQPSGRMQVLSRKVNLVDLEPGLDLSAGTAADLSVFEARARATEPTDGNRRPPRVTVGCLVCADGWHPELARRLVDSGARVLLQVSASTSTWTPGTRKGWQNSLFSRVQELGVYGVCAMGVGRLLDVSFQGQSAILAPQAQTKDGSGYVAEARSGTGEEVVTATLDIRG